VLGQAPPSNTFMGRQVPVPLWEGKYLNGSFMVKKASHKASTSMGRQALIPLIVRQVNGHYSKEVRLGFELPLGKGVGFELPIVRVGFERIG